MSELPLLESRVQYLIDEARDIDDAFREFVAFVQVSKVRPLRPKTALDTALEQVDGEKRPEFYDDWGWTPTREQREQQRAIISRYEVWFNASAALVYQYLPNRWDDFAVVYPYIKSILECESVMPHAAGKRFDEEYRTQQHRRFSQSFDRQVDMLLSVPEVVMTKALHLRRLVVNEMVSTDLEHAERMLEAGGGEPVVRAAGVIAGVALEKHLKLVADEHNGQCSAAEDEISYDDDDGIAEMARKLGRMNLLEPTELAMFERLHAICHNCSCAPEKEGEAPTHEDVAFLVAKARECVSMEFFE